MTHPILTMTHPILTVSRCNLAPTHRQLALSHPILTATHLQLTVSHPILTASHLQLTVSHPNLVASQGGLAATHPRLTVSHPNLVASRTALVTTRRSSTKSQPNLASGHTQLTETQSKPVMSRSILALGLSELTATQRHAELTPRHPSMERRNRGTVLHVLVVTRSQSAEWSRHRVSIRFGPKVGRARFPVTRPGAPETRLRLAAIRSALTRTHDIGGVSDPAFASPAGVLPSRLQRDTPLPLSSFQETCMARFPKTEPEIAALAVVVIQGLRDHPEQFPTPPVPPDVLQAALDAFNEAKTAAVAAEAAARDRVAAKNDALEQLADHMRLVFTYAEVAAKEAPDQLAKIGWGPRRDPRKPELPGIVRDLAVKSQGADWFVLDWKAPNDGGTPAAYHIERRRRDGGEWEEIAHAIASEDLLTGQEQGVEWEFRVYAENRAGIGERSTVLAVEL